MDGRPEAVEYYCVKKQLVDQISKAMYESVFSHVLDVTWIPIIFFWLKIHSTGLTVQRRKEDKNI